MAEDVKLDTDPLDMFLKSLKSVPDVKVGIIEDSTRADGQTNVQVGMRHEFGTGGMPMRSFLRIPLMMKMTEALRGRGTAFTKDVVKEMITTHSAKPLMEKLGALAAAIVRGGFMSRGYGTWQEWSPGYKNATGDILVDTRQLESSISYKVEE